MKTKYQTDRLTLFATWPNVPGGPYPYYAGKVMVVETAAHAPPKINAPKARGVIGIVEGSDRRSVERARTFACETAFACAVADDYGYSPRELRERGFDL